MLINMYDSRWYELTFGIHLFKHICLIMRMSFVSYRTEFKIYFECSDGLARAKITLTFECKSISIYTLIAESASHV